MAVHPPAMGGKTAWGVSEVISRPTDDPEDIIKMRKLQADFSEREHDRLNRLKALDSSASEILEARKARRLEYQPASTNGDDFKKRQDEILRKMHEAKERRRIEKLERKRGARPAKVKKRQKSAGASDSADSSASSESSASSGSRSSQDSGAGSRVKRRAAEEAEDNAAAPRGLEEQQPEAKRKAEELKARERELRRRAKEHAAAWAAEAKRREAESEARRQAEVKRRAEEAEAKRQAEAKRKTEEEARRRAEEADAKQKSSAGSEAKRKLFQIEKRRAGFDDAARRETVAGGFYKGQRVVATQDITVRGALVVKAGAAGTVVGPSESDPTGRIAVRFLQREDTALGNLNVVPREIKKG